MTWSSEMVLRKPTSPGCLAEVSQVFSVLWPLPPFWSVWLTPDTTVRRSRWSFILDRYGVGS